MNRLIYFPQPERPKRPASGSRRGQTSPPVDLQRQLSADIEIEQAEELDNSNKKSDQGNDHVHDISRTASVFPIVDDKIELYRMAEKVDYIETNLKFDILNALEKAGINTKSVESDFINEIKRIIEREVHRALLKGDFFKKIKVPQLELPESAPELYQNRPNKKETAKDFLERVWGKYLDADVLFQCDLRGKNGRDPKLMNAIVSYCAVRKLKVSDIIPPKKNKTDSRAKNFSLEAFLNNPERFSKVAMAFYQRQKRRTKK